VAVLATCLAAVVAVGAWVLSGATATPMLVPLWIGLLCLPLTALARVTQASSMGLGRVVTGQFPEQLLRPLLFLVLAIGVALWIGLDAAGALWLQLLTTAVGLAVSLRLLRRALPPHPRHARPAYRDREWARSSLELALLSGAAVLNAQTGTFLLGALRSPDEAGLYAVATRGALLISFGLTAVNAALAPAAARMWAAGDVERLQRLVTLSARGVVAFSFPVAILFMVFAGTVLEVGFGAEYLAAAPALTILSLGQLANATLGSVGTLLIMTGHQREAAAGISVGAVLNVLLGSLLIPAQGVTGAAIAATVSIIAWNVLLALVASRRLGVHPTAIGRVGWRGRRHGRPDAPPATEDEPPASEAHARR
jgi:O-antigen/teichoic acid export membrane protein